MGVLAGTALSAIGNIAGAYRAGRHQRTFDSLRTDGFSAAIHRDAQVPGLWHILHDTGNDMRMPYNPGFPPQTGAKIPSTSGNLPAGKRTFG